MSSNRFFSALLLAAAIAAPGLSAHAATPVAVQGDLVDTLKLSGQFTTFVGGIDATNLAGLLRTNKNLTVFAPTDAAFAAMPAADLANLKANKAAMQKFVLHHVVNAPITSDKIKGVKGPIPSGAGDTILLDGTDYLTTAWWLVTFPVIAITLTIGAALPCGPADLALLIAARRVVVVADP
jgi:hypothetical protein